MRKTSAAGSSCGSCAMSPGLTVTFKGILSAKICDDQVSFRSQPKLIKSYLLGESRNRSEGVKLDDRSIIDLYWARDEKAIQETAAKYGKLCAYIAKNILKCNEDREECVNDTYFTLWNLIPVQRPNRFSVFISRITRNIALKKYEYLSAEKRDPSAILSLDELEDCVSGRYSIETEVENKRIEQAIDTFLGQQGHEKRNIFIRRYWYFDPIESICKSTGYSQSKVKSILYQMRLKLRKYLESEGIDV